MRASPYSPQTWKSAFSQAKGNITYAVVGDFVYDNGVLDDAEILGEYLANEGFLLQTIGTSQLERAFISGCKRGGGFYNILDPYDIFERSEDLIERVLKEGDPHFVFFACGAMEPILTKVVVVGTEKGAEERYHTCNLNNPPEIQKLMSIITGMNAL